MVTLIKINRLMVGSKWVGVALGLLVATSLWSADFSFTTGNPDGLMGAASRRASPGKLETETADDFTLDQTTVIRRATIVGLVPSGTQQRDIREVEVEVYHVFPLDSALPPSGRVPSRANSPPLMMRLPFQSPASTRMASDFSGGSLDTRKLPMPASHQGELRAISARNPAAASSQRRNRRSYFSSFDLGSRWPTLRRRW